MTERDRAGFFEFLLASGMLTKDDLLASVTDVLFAGVYTTSNTMQWVLYMLAKNPEIIQWLEILPLHAGNARSYVIPKGLVTRDPPPIPCSLCYPAREDRRKTSYWGATIFLGALLKLSSLFTKWGEMRVFLKTPKRLNRRDDCETKMPL